MSYISDAHVEFAVVQRLNRLLQETAKTEFEVTCAYGLFTALLCWTLQRLRIDKNTTWKKLFEEAIDSPRWRVFEEKPGNIIQFSSAYSTATIKYLATDRVVDMADFLSKLRDSTAHGDHRTISPFHTKIADTQMHVLKGFTFVLKRTRREGETGNKYIEIAKVTLEHADMLRIGNELATKFVEFIAPNPNFVQKSNRDVKEAA
jgi:hypothetical protein